jgi:hypothetical protein
MRIRRLRDLDKLFVKRLESCARIASGFFTGLVAIGLIGELYEASSSGAAILFLALVSVGVVGEFLMLTVEWPLSRRLDTIEREEDTAHSLELKRLASEAEQARMAIAEADARAAEANARAEEARRDLESLRAETLRLEALRADRHISLSQSDLITARLGKFVPMEVGLIFCRDPSGETLRFGLEVWQALKCAGWSVSTATRDDPVRVVGYLAIEAGTNADQASHFAARELIEVFEEIGFHVREEPRPFGGNIVGDEAETAQAARIRLTVGEHKRGY